MQIATLSVFLIVMVLLLVGAPAFLKAPPPPPSQAVHIRGGRFNKFCGVDGNKNVHCNHDATNDITTFFVEPQADGRYALKNKFTNQYCQDNGDKLTCNRGQALEQEKFHWRDQPEPNTFAMTGPKSGSKRLYCSDEGNRIACNRQSVGGWEKFTYHAVAGSPDASGMTEGASVRSSSSSASTSATTETAAPASDGFWSIIWRFFFG